MLIKDNQLKLLERISILKEFPETNTGLILTSYSYRINNATMIPVHEYKHVCKFQNIVLKEHQLDFDRNHVDDAFTHTLTFDHTGYSYKLEQ